MTEGRTHPCPKCHRTLQQSGELVVHLDGEDALLPVFQCDQCLMTVDICGEQMEIALTFGVDRTGQVIDPADPENKLRF